MSELHRYVRRPGIESDYHLLEPMEFHADTTELVQMLRKGHHGVQLDAEAWDRLVTWIDLNCPFHGTWGEELPGSGRAAPARRRELLKLYGNVDDDPEAVPPAAIGPTNPPSCPSRRRRARPRRSNVPAGRSTRPRRSGASRRPARATRQTIDLGDGVPLELVLVPRRRVRHGQRRRRGRRAAARAGADRPAVLDGTLRGDQRQYARFDPGHDSRVEDKNAYQFGIHGYPMNRPEQPVVRVIVAEAMAFCRWLRRRPASGSRCRPKPSGNTPAGPARRRRSPTATWTPTFSRSPTWPTPSSSSSPATLGHDRQAAQEPDQVRRLDPQGRRGSTTGRC